MGGKGRGGGLSTPEKTRRVISYLIFNPIEAKCNEAFSGQKKIYSIIGKSRNSALFIIRVTLS